MVQKALFLKSLDRSSWTSFVDQVWQIKTTFWSAFSRCTVYEDVVKTLSCQTFAPMDKILSRQLKYVKQLFTEVEVSSRYYPEFG